MASIPATSVVLDLPQGASRSALRAGLMASHIPPSDMPRDARQRAELLQDLVEQRNTFFFIDIAALNHGENLSLLDLNRLIPQGDCRQRVFLTRLEGDHVSLADRYWVRSLGFADLYPEFSIADIAGPLGQALKAMDVPVEQSEMASNLSAMVGETKVSDPRDRLRRLTGLSAETLTHKLRGLINVRDRTFRLKTYPQCFVGEEATTTIAKTFRCSHTQAVALGQDLGTLGLLEHVTDDHAFESAHLYFRWGISDVVDRLPLGQVYAGLASKEGVPVEDRSYLGRSYPRCWIGSEAVDWLCKRYKLSRHDSVVVLRRFAQFGLVEHVLQEHAVKDRDHFYRFVHGSGLENAAS
jgi:hypothetical protein